MLSNIKKSMQCKIWTIISKTMTHLNQYGSLSYFFLIHSNMVIVETGNLYLGENNPVNIYLFKVNNRNPRKGCEICSKLTIKTPEQRQWSRLDVFIVNFKHIAHFFLLFLSFILLINLFIYLFIYLFFGIFFFFFTIIEL